MTPLMAGIATHLLTFAVGIAIGLLLAHERAVWDRSREDLVGRRRALQRLDKDAA